MARKQTTIVRCDGDGCQIVAEVENLNETPSGWYQIRQASDLGKLPSSGFDLCSLGCVKKWATARAVVLGQQKNPVRHSGGTKNTAELVVETLREMGELSSSEIQTLIDRTQSVTDTALKGLVELGTVVVSREGNHTKADPRKYTLTP